MISVPLAPLSEHNNKIRVKASLLVGDMRELQAKCHLWLVYRGQEMEATSCPLWLASVAAFVFSFPHQNRRSFLSVGVSFCL